MAGLSPGGSARILLVSADPTLREELSQVLERRLPGHQLYWVSEPDLAVGRADELIPDVILVDDALGGRDPIPFIRRLAAAVSSAAVLALVSEDATRAAGQAVLAGARGFATKPLVDDDLVATLRQVLAPGREPLREEEAERGPEGRVVVLCAPKGGTGRTTLAINLATSLQKLSGEPVALVDADYAAPALDVALNINPERDVADLLPRLSQLDEALISAVLQKHASGLEVLLAPPPADLSSPISLPRVQRILVVLQRMFPWVVVDLGLPLDETAFAFLDSADRILVSALPEMVGLRNTRLLLEQLRDRGYAEDKVWLVLNRADMKGGVSRGDIERRLQVPFERSVPDDQPLTTHSINRGVPLVISHPRSAVGRAIRGFAKELMDDLSPGVERERARPGAARPATGNVGAAIRQHLVSFAAVGAGVLALVLLGLLRGQWQTGGLLGLLLLIVGVVLYRRGR
jgi:pilus assembly protein CpaE